MQTGFWWILLAMALYGGLHSLLASLSAKTLAFKLTGACGYRFYRLLFNVIVTVTFVPVLALVLFLPDAEIYRAPAPARYVLMAVQLLGLAGLVAGLLQTDIGRFSGLRQARECAAHPLERGQEGELVVSGLYSRVRHPLYTAGLMLIWFTPRMTWNYLALALGVTAYILIGAKLEEHKLAREFGGAYRAYMHHVPMLVPTLKRPLSRHCARIEYCNGVCVMDTAQLPDRYREWFNGLVWEIARQIPAGRVASYGQIAGYIPVPRGMDAKQFAAFRARWAGQAMSACPKDVPWQRVVNAQGKISYRAGESAGVPRQRVLLEAEGVIFDDHERIDLKLFGWDGPPRAWLLERGLNAPGEDYQQQTLL